MNESEASLCKLELQCHASVNCITLVKPGLAMAAALLPFLLLVMTTMLDHAKHSYLTASS